MGTKTEFIKQGTGKRVWCSCLHRAAQGLMERLKQGGEAGEIFLLRVGKDSVPRALKTGYLSIFQHTSHPTLQGNHPRGHQFYSKLALAAGDPMLAWSRVSCG